MLAEFSTISSEKNRDNPKITLFGENTETIYQKKAHALIGVSPFNGYFTEERLIQLIHWGLTTFDKITVFLPDEISVFTLMALGYPHKKAAYKTRRQDQYLKNKIFRAFKFLGLNVFEAQQSFITMTMLLHNNHYQTLYEDCLNRFEKDMDFKQGCLSTSSWMLANHLKLSSSVKTNQIHLAVEYFLKEMPLFLDTPRILDVNASLFVYHAIPQYLQDLYTSGQFISPHQGYLQLQFEESY